MEENARLPWWRRSKLPIGGGDIQPPCPAMGRRGSGGGGAVVGARRGGEAEEGKRHSESFYSAAERWSKYKGMSDYEV